MFRSYKNLKILIDNKELVTSSIQISTDANSVGVLKQENIHAHEFNQKGGLKNSVRLTYHISGDDPIKPYIQLRETGVIVGDFGGLVMESGYLSSYSMRGVSNQAVTVNASIDFFDDLKGSFSPTYERKSNSNFLHFTDATISHLSEGSLGSIDNIIGFSYDYQGNVSPSYNMNDLTALDNVVPDRVLVEEKRTSMSLVVDNLDQDLPMNGKKAYFKVNIQHPEIDYNEVIELDGNLTSKQLSTSINRNVEATLTVNQEYPGISPQITGFIPDTFSPGEEVRISGKNFEEVTHIYFDDLESSGFSVLSDSLILAYPPVRFQDGLLRVVTQNGEAITGGYTAGALEMSVTAYELFENFGELVDITGQNFYNISHVNFSGTSGDTDGEFEVLSPEVIRVEVPDGAQRGRILIINTGQGEDVQIFNDFYPIPEIDGFAPETGMSGTYITITGKGFADIQKVTINNLLAPIINNGPNENTVEVEVPSGNTFGLIRVSGDFEELVDLSSTNFYPQITIDHIDPPIGYEGDSVTIFGENFMPELMVAVDGADGFFNLQFGGGITGEFERINFGKLEGEIPLFAETGPVQIMGPSSYAYPSEIEWTNLGTGPFIDSLIPFTGSQSSQMAIQGSGFKTLEWIMFSGQGDGGSDIESGFSGDSSIVFPDILGNQINFDIPFNMDTGVFTVVTKTSGGIDWSDDIFEVTLPIIDGSSGVSGVAGDQFSGNYGTFTATDETKTVVWHNVTDFDIRLVFPPTAGISWDGKPSGQGYPINITAKSSEDVSGIIVDDSFLTPLYLDVTGYFTSDDDYSGNVNFYANLTP
tara:strand:+ start:17299 stop:19743 length:2445 start_codon:yes stop_codon:yes gene_type:complete